MDGPLPRRPPPPPPPPLSPPSYRTARNATRKSRSEEECIPRIWQNDLLASTGGRRALALLHSHQVADIGQHRLEVRHFPWWLPFVGGLSHDDHPLGRRRMGVLACVLFLLLLPSLLLLLAVVRHYRTRSQPLRSATGGASAVRFSLPHIFSVTPTTMTTMVTTRVTTTASAGMASRAIERT